MPKPGGLKMKYHVPKNYKNICDGKGCICGAHEIGECSCTAIWVTEQEYDLMKEVNKLRQALITGLIKKLLQLTCLINSIHTV